MGAGELEEFLDDIKNHFADTRFLEKLGKIGGFKEDACWMEGDGSAFC